MGPPPIGCMGMMQEFEGRRKLCPALEKLKDEHQSLAEQMNDLVHLANSLKSTAEPTKRKKGLTELHELASLFRAELEKHSRREEEDLYPLMANYIEREMGPIAVMEEEHDLIHESLMSFMRIVEMEKSEPVEVEAVHIHLLKSIEILMEHFFKEESVLFPMAEYVLSDAEKEQLRVLFQD
ncbi:hemerythrin domain-containing protein [Brevibacillus brevis]|uniref:Hemerythrin domain-containing protein n=2 Tax=Brevibacillus brevis TaxID=1393 RepID=A0A2Z4MN77_BREBE|nr:hemerythrin domain-containing protein [Brevibacillus brevis]